MSNLRIGWITRFCPVQAEGTVCGVPFYFRARGRRWTMGIGKDPIGIGAVINNAGPEEWYCESTWGTEKFAAGWMPEDEALRLIEWCASEYAQNAARASPTAKAGNETTPHTPRGEIASPEPNLGQGEGVP